MRFKKWIDGITRIENRPRPEVEMDLRYCEWTRPLEEVLFDEYREMLTWEDFALYPDVSMLRHAIAAKHNIAEASVYLGHGSDEVLKNVFDCFEEGSKVLTTDPCFPMYDVYAQQNNLDIAKISPTLGRNGEIFYSISNFRDTGADLVVISRPFSPVGTEWGESTVMAMVDNEPDTLFVIDEAYVDYMERPGNLVELSTYRRNLLVSRSFSKGAGAAGCRVGYLTGTPETLAKIAKFRPMYEVAGPSMLYALFLLTKSKELENYQSITKKERVAVCKFFGEHGYETICSEGNWIHVKDKDGLATFFEARKIAVRICKLPLLEGAWIRMTVGPGVLKALKKLFVGKV
jgi:histidinol-phosphate aminotransferase